MPININMPDTRIARGNFGSGGGDGGGASNPFQTFGQLVGLREARDQMETRRLQLDKMREAEDDDRAIRETLQRYESPDEAIGDLYHQGRSSAANVLSKQVYDHRKAQADAYKDQLANYGQRLKLSGNIMSGVTDDPSYQNARPAVEAMLKPIFGDGVADILPTTFDKDHVDKLLKMGMDAQERNQQDQNAVVNAREAIRLQNQTANDNEQYKKNQLEARKYWQGSLSTGLGNSRNQAEWDFWQQQAVENGAPKDLVAGFGRQWSPDAAAHAKRLGLTSAQEEADVARDAAGVRADRRLELAEAAAARAEANAAGGGAGTRITATRQSDITQDTAKEYAKLEAEIREAHMNKTTGAFDPIPEGMQKEYGRRRLTIADADRRARLLPTYDESIAQAQKSGDAAGLAKLQREKDSLLTGGGTATAPAGTATTPAPAPRPKPAQDAARAQELATQLNSGQVTDPAVKARMRAELREISGRLYPTPTSR